MKLIFVYNAQSDPVSAAIGFAHKAIRPSTYACNLCKLTHGTFGEFQRWKEFRESTSVELDFWYIRAFEKRFGASHGPYPCVFEQQDEVLIPVLDKGMLEQLETTEALIKSLEGYLRLNH